MRAGSPPEMVTAYVAVRPGGVSSVIIASGYCQQLLSIIFTGSATVDLNISDPARKNRLFLFFLGAYINQVVTNEPASANSSTPESPSLTPFILLCLIGFLSFFSSYLRMPVLPLYASGFGADTAQVGMITGAFLLTAGLLSIPAGLVTDRFGRRGPIVAGIVAIPVSSLLIALCRQPLQMAAVYVLFGAGLAAFAPAMLSLVADILPPAKLGQGYGWYTTAVYTAMTFGPASGGFLARAVGQREVFLISGSLSLGVALLALLILPAGRSRHRAALTDILAGSRDLFRNRSLIACLVATVGSCIGFGVFITFLPLCATARGADPGQVGIVFAAQAGTNVLCRVPIGLIADRFAKERLVAAGLLLLAPALVAIGRATTIVTMAASAVGIGIGMALTYTAIGAIIVEQVPARQRGLAMGLYNSCIYLGMMAGSTGLGLALRRVSYPTGFAVAGGITLAALLIFSFGGSYSRGERPPAR